jgi:hypothetical protein
MMSSSATKSCGNAEVDPEKEQERESENRNNEKAILRRKKEEQKEYNTRRSKTDREALTYFSAKSIGKSLSTS